MSTITKTAYRTTMPFDGGLSPVTDKSRAAPLFGDTPHFYNSQNSKIIDLHGRGNWGDGEDVSKSYKEKGDEFMMDNTMMNIIKRINEKKQSKKERWVVNTVNGQTIEFPSYDAAQTYLHKNKQPYTSINRKVAQNIAKKFEYIEKTLAATLQIRSYNSQTNTRETGSAFAIADGRFLTCAHCVKKYDKMNMPSDNEHHNMELSLWKQNKQYPASLIAIDFALDAALIQCDATSDVLQLGVSSDVSIGTPVVAVGSPSGFEDNVTEGILSSKNRTIFRYDGAPTFVFTDAQVLPGLSGGPLVSLNDGMVVGMMALIISDVGLYGLNAAVPSEYLINFITHKG